MAPFSRIARAVALLALTIGVLPLMGCLRTTHKVETYHKIDAHIVLDVRQIRDEAEQVETYVRSDDPAPQAGGDQPVSRAWTEPLPDSDSLFARVFRFSPVALAVTPQEADAAKKARKERSKQVDEALTKHWVGEDDHGYLAVRLGKDEDKELRARVDALVKAENRDRKTIYQEIAERKGNGKELLEAVEIIFADEIRNKLKKGQLFRAPRDAKGFDVFRDSPLGRKYPDARPGDWLEKR
ncbi:MAG TPA: DUF1318 domain-containing protein [Candidatus Sumerlaeota bacterium]|nr:DUF1318 domain-containing protein [Candidatus Sumerlaeota bacterium]